MPSVNTGNNKKIKSIRIFKDHATLTFYHGEQLKISKEAFVSSYLYAGKSLSSKEITKLEEITAMSNLLQYGSSLAVKKRYSEKGMLDKLLKKENNYTAAKSVIKKLKDNGLLDDKAFMDDLIAWDNQKNLGQNKIIKHLIYKGIPQSLVSNTRFSSSLEKKKAKALLEKLEKKYDRFAYPSKKKHVFQALVAQGFSADVAKEVAEEVKRGNDKKELVILQKDYDKAKARYSKKYEGYQLKQKVYAFLFNKGYKYEDIKKVLDMEDFD